MKILKQPSENINKLCEEQEITGGIHYRPFIYVSLTEVDGTLLACNRFTGCLAAVSPDEAEILRNGTDNASSAAELIKYGFLVPEEHDDYQYCVDTRELLKIFSPPSKTKSYVIMTTLDCNARCFYCYQMGRNRNRSAMTLDTAKAVAEYIIKTSKGCDVRIQWYGGEPLMNTEVIDSICDALALAGVNYKSSMISNGFLVTEELVKKAVELWKLKNIQSPLDGTEEPYNRIKAYVNIGGISAYYVVMNSIDMLLKHSIRVVVRVNLDNHNKEDIFKLADELAARFGENKEFSLYSDVLYENAGTKKPQRLSAERLELVNSLVEFENYCEKIGINVPAKLSSGIKMFRCMADSGNSVVISPQGELGLCDHAMESHIFGSVFSDDKNKELIDSWKKVFNSKDTCSKCPNYPDCVRLVNCPDDGPLLCDAAYKTKMFHRHKQAVVKEYRKHISNQAGEANGI